MLAEERMGDKPLVEKLKEIVGPKGWTTDADELEPHLTEWRGVVRGATLIMVSPATTADVAAVVRACHKAGVALVPQGGNTGLCGGAIPDASGQQVLLSLSRLNQVRRVDANDFSIVVEAGCILADVQQAAAKADRLFPLSLSAEGTCQIGGNLSTNAGGINVLRYGTAAQQVLGLEVVLADGTVWSGLRTLRKDTAGYDVKQLFLGSEGTLGIITAAALRLFPRPGQVATAFLALANADVAVELLGQIRERHSERTQAFELMSDRALEFVRKHVTHSDLPFTTRSAWYVLLDIDTGGEDELLERLLADSVETGQIVDVILAKNGMEAEHFWRLRHAISEAQKHEGVSLKHDISVPISRMGEFLRRSEALVATRLPSARPVIFGHVGDGNLHYNVSQAAGADPDAFIREGRELTTALYELVTEFEGSISAEHGIGVLKRDALGQYRSTVELELMRTLKRALDPNNILNPGKVI